MSINATVDNTTYEGITAISAVAKTFALTEVQEESGGGGDIWHGASEMNIRWLINKMKNPTKTGTFSPAAIPASFTQMFDTELGDNWEYIVIYDESANSFPTNQYTAIWFFVVRKSDYKCLRAALKTNTMNLYSVFNPETNSTIRISEGKVSMKCEYGTQVIYTPVLVGRTYRWCAW